MEKRVDRKPDAPQQMRDGLGDPTAHYLHREGPNLGKHLCPLLPITISLDAQIGTPYPRSPGFGTDKGRHTPLCAE